MQNKVHVLKKASSGAFSGYDVPNATQSLFIPPPLPPMVRSVIMVCRSQSSAIILTPS
jgi:hypothetical protein